MTNHFRCAFTLFDLLAVIVIIGLLVGLLLPTVQGSRESSRRTTCTANQQQLAAALIGYENNKKAFPPMRGEMFTDCPLGGEGTMQATWVAYLLPYMEMEQVWAQLANGKSMRNGQVPFHRLAIPTIKCKSAAPGGDNSMNYVVNGGYQNAFGTSWDAATTVVTCDDPIYVTLFSEAPRFEPGRQEDAVFFDWLGLTNDIKESNRPWCKQRISIDYITSNSGTSCTLLISENVNAGNWINWDETNNGTRADGEEKIAFCYPFNIHEQLESVIKINETENSLTQHGENDAVRPWMGYERQNPATTHAPLFINIGKTLKFDPSRPYLQARPSSNHPGVVNAAFADHSVRTLNENMDKKVFVHLCMPKM